MVVVLLLAWALGWRDGIEWSIPLAAWMGWMAARLLALANNSGVAARNTDTQKLAAFHLPFVRAELPGFLLNVSANHGQVLLIGALGGDAAAGTAALALRIAMLPTSLFGLALADRLRSRVVALSSNADLMALLRQAIKRMAGLSLAAHALAAVCVPLLLPLVFPSQGAVLVQMVMWLLAGLEPDRPMPAVCLCAAVGVVGFSHQRIDRCGRCLRDQRRWGVSGLSRHGMGCGASGYLRFVETGLYEQTRQGGRAA